MSLNAIPRVPRGPKIETQAERDLLAKHKILVFIPAFNEFETIAGVINDVKEQMPSVDILVIDDGSDDQTRERALATGALVIRLVNNSGIGAAHQTGFLYAEQEGYHFFGQLDADGQHRAKDLRLLLNEVILGQEADLVIGSRFLLPSDLKQGQDYRSSRLRRLGIVFFRRIIKLLTGGVFTDPTSGLRAGNRRVIRLFARRYSHDYAEIESIQRLVRQKARVKELAVTMLPRQVGKSKITPWLSGYYMFKCSLLLFVGHFRPLERESE